MNNSLIKEAENIINEYIRENHYDVLPDRRGRIKRKRLLTGRLFSNPAVSIALLAGAALLIYLILRLI